MTRVTGTVPKLSNAFRGISTSASRARPSSLLESTHLPRRLSDLKHECQLLKLDTAGSKQELTVRLSQSRAHSTTGGHRPTPSAAPEAAHIFRPLMQGFRTSAPVATVEHDMSSVDFFFLPSLNASAHESQRLRVPLLPDNFSPDRSQYALEAADEAVPRPEISIVAAHPERVAPAALTEVVGNAGLEEGVDTLTSLFNGGSNSSSRAADKEQQGVVKELFGGMWQDMFGAKRSLA